MVALFLAVALGAQVEVERVVALVNGVPILVSDVELAEIAALVPHAESESPAEYRNVVAEALVLLALRWQDLDVAGVTSRTAVDLAAAWASVVTRAGGVETLREQLRAVGLDEALLRALVRRAAIVQAYVGTRFAPFIRPTANEVETVYRDELAPQLVATGKVAPPLVQVRAQVEALVRERKLNTEIARWTDELERRGEVIRYFKR